MPWLIGVGIAIAVFGFSTTRTRKAIPRVPSYALAAMGAPGGRSGSASDMSEEDVPPRPPNEFERVLSYREQMFRLLGFSDTASIILAEVGADWHEAEKLIEAGCPRDVALNLLT